MRRSVHLLALAALVGGTFISQRSSADLADQYAAPVTGEGEKLFGEADPKTGAMTQTIPIAVPRARGLPQPKLALRYNSSSRDREAGYGWGLDLPVIERRPLSNFPEFSGGEPVGEERYTFSGKLLVRICQLPSCPAENNTSGHPQWALDGGWWYYRLQVDGGATRFYRSADRLTWRVLLPGGERLEFGKALDEGATLGLTAYEQGFGSTPVNLGIVRWHLVAQKDPQHPKNFILYKWRTADPSALISRRMKLTDIYYTPAVSAGVSFDAFAHHVQLDWEAVGYPMPTYLSAEQTVLPVRLNRIAVASQDWTTTGTGTRHVDRAYELAYLAPRTAAAYDPATTGPLWHHSFLKQVQIRGRCRDGGAEQSGQIPLSLTGCPSLPPTTFTYERGDLQGSVTSQSVILDGPGGDPIESVLDTVVVDFDRDGRPDIVSGWPTPKAGVPEYDLNCPRDAGQNVFQTKVVLSQTTGQPELWCQSAAVSYHDPSTPSDDETTDIESAKVRSARPIRGYLNAGLSPTPTAYQFRYQCMDAGDGTLGTLTEIASHDIKARLLNGQGSTVLASAGNAVAFWQDWQNYYPIVARPISADPQYANLGCLLDDTFDPQTFHPVWRWEPEVPYLAPPGEFARTQVNLVKGSSDWDIWPEGTAEPAYFVDVDGDGFADKLAEDEPRATDLFRARVYFTRYYSRTSPPGSGASGAMDGPALVPFAEELVPGAVSLVPSRKVRSGLPDGNTHFWYADVNGDGIVDLVMANPGDGMVPRVFPGDGRGRFECDENSQPTPNTCLVANPGDPAFYSIEVISDSKPWTLLDPQAGFDPVGFLMHDVTGDGLADIVAVRDSGVYVWVNVDGTQFACLSTQTDPCRVGTLGSPIGIGASVLPTRITFADMDADGVDDIVLVQKQGIQVVRLYGEGDPSAAAHAPRPGLLVKIDNGVGATTSIRYDSIQDLDSQASPPFSFHSPVVGMVVTQIRTEDTQYATTGIHLNEPYAIERSVEYGYRDPAYDRWKRQLVGFRSVGRRIGGEQAITETTYWYGPCERDDVVAVAPSDPSPTTNRCPRGSDDDFDDAPTYRSFVGKPVRVDRYIPGNASQDGQSHYLWSKTIRYADDGVAPDTNYLFVAGGNVNRNVTTTYAHRITTVHYDASQPVGLGPVSVIDPEGDPVQDSPTQSGSKITRMSFGVLPESGQLFGVTDSGDVEGGDTAVTTERYAAMNENWQYLPDSVPVFFDTATTARDNWLYYNSTTGDLEAIEADPGGTTTLDRFHEAAGATAPTPSHSDGWSRLAEFEHDADTGTVTEVRGSPWTDAPQSCTRFVLDDAFHEFPRQVIQFKNGCDSPEPLITDLGFDRAFGVVVAKTAPDAGMSSVELDGFGRPVSVSLPDPGDPSFPQQVWSARYRDQSPLSFVDAAEVTLETPTITIRHFKTTNALGEPVLSFTSDVGGAYSVSGWTERDGGGKVSLMRRPFTSTEDPPTVAGNATAPGIPGGGATGYFEIIHDGFGRLSESRENGAPILQRTYGPLSLTIKDQAQLAGGSHEGALTQLLFNGRGQVKSATSTGAFGSVTTTTTFDGLGEPLSISKSDGSSTYTRTMTWDRLGRLVENDEPNTSKAGHHWRYVYDDAGHLVGTSDARGCGKNLFYDGLNRVTGEDYSPCLASQPSYTGDADPDFLEVRYVYDQYEAGQPVTPEPGFADHEPEALGNLVAIYDRGSHTRFNYDSRGRVRRTARRVVKRPGFTPTTGDGYAAHWFTQRADFDVSGRLFWRTSGVDTPEFLQSGESSETYTYNRRGLVSRIDSSYGELVDEIDYEADARPSFMRYGDTASTYADFVYDDRRRLHYYNVLRNYSPLWSSPTPPPSYPLPDASTTQTELAAFSFTYDEVGNPTLVDDTADYTQYPEDAYPIGQRYAEYDDLYRVTRVEHSYGPNGFAAFKSPFDAEVTSGDTRPVPLQQVPYRVQGQRFFFDGLGNTTLTLDDVDTNFDRSLGTITNGSGTDGPNQLRAANGVEAAYDPAGNIVTLKVTRQGTCPSGAGSKCAQWFAYDWDEVGQLVRARRWDFDTTLPLLGAGEVPSDSPAWDLEYAYSMGVRVQKSAKDATGVQRHTIDVFDTLRFDHVAFDENTEDYARDAIATHLSLGGGVGHIVYRDDMPYVTSPVHRFLNIGDHLGSASVTIDAETSELVERTTYQAYGAMESDYRPDRWDAHREDWKFTGKEEDIEVGMTYFGARYYQPYLGRWASADPLTIHGLGGDLNPYAYVGGNVLSSVDPFGPQRAQPLARAVPERCRHRNGCSTGRRRVGRHGGTRS